MVAAVRAGNMELAEVGEHGLCMQSTRSATILLPCFFRALELGRQSSSCCATPGGHANDDGSLKTAGKMQAQKR